MAKIGQPRHHPAINQIVLQKSYTLRCSLNLNKKNRHLTGGQVPQKRFARMRREGSRRVAGTLRLDGGALPITCYPQNSVNCSPCHVQGGIRVSSVALPPTPSLCRALSQAGPCRRQSSHQMLQGLCAARKQSGVQPFASFHSRSVITVALAPFVTRLRSVPFLPTRSPTVATTGLLSAIWGADPVTRTQSTGRESTRDSDRMFLLSASLH
jgi:hypothetical protein